MTSKSINAKRVAYFKRKFPDIKEDHDSCSNSPGFIENAVYEYNGVKYHAWGLHCSRCGNLEIDDFLNCSGRTRNIEEVDAWSNQIELMKDIEARERYHY